VTERTLLDSPSPVTQSVDSVKALLDYMGRASDPLPSFLELAGGRCILLLSNKQDVYYTVTPKACSCPSANFRPQACKHQRKYFPEDARDRAGRPLSMAEVLAEHDKNLPKMPKSYQRMVRAAREEAEEDPDSIMPKGKWPGGHNGPVEPDTIMETQAL